MVVTYYDGHKTEVGSHYVKSRVRTNESSMQLTIHKHHEMAERDEAVTVLLTPTQALSVAIGLLRDISLLQTGKG